MVFLYAILGCAPDLLQPIDVSLHTGPGLRDLEARVDGAPRFTWFEDDQPTDVRGRVVPADRLWPGSTWRVDVEDADGRRGTASLTIPEPEQPNVVVVLMDDVGVDKLTAYNGPWAAHTPTLDALAADGLRFTRAYASSVCSPTRGSLLSGLHPQRTGLGWITDTGGRVGQLPGSVHTIPEVLRATRASAYTTTALGKWHVIGPNVPGWLDHPLDQGFDHFAGTPGNPEYSPGRGYFNWTKNTDGHLSESATYLTTDTANDFLDALDTLPEPFFLYVAFNAPHGPLHIPPAELYDDTLSPETATWMQKYDAMLEALDTEYGRVLDSMDPELRERTTFITLGDNGTMPRGIPPEAYSNRFKHTPYEGGVHVPFIVNGPLVERPGTTTDALVHVVDLLPTIAELAGVPLEGPEGQHVVLESGALHPVDGRSILPILRGDTTRSMLYTEAFNPNGGIPRPANHQRSVRNATHKLLRWGDIEQLFRLDRPDELDVDALDRRDMNRDDRDNWQRLLTTLDRWEERLSAPTGDGTSVGD